MADVKDVTALIADREENGCNHPNYYPRETGGGLVPRYLGGWCLICDEWLRRLRALSPEQF